MVGLLQAKKLNELEKYLLENMDKLNIKTVLEKKSEKGLIQYIKYANRDAIKSLKGDLEVFISIFNIFNLGIISKSISQHGK